MANNFYKVNAGDIPMPTDVNQYADGFQGNADVGQLNLADNIGAPSSALSAAVASGSGLSIGAYQYAYTYVTGYKKTSGTLVINGETTLSPVTNITTTSGNQVVNLTNIGTSSAPYVIARRIYRTWAAPSSAPTLAASGSGNTLSPATYYVKFTWVYAGGGESLPSPEASQAVTSGQQLTVTIPSFPTGVASANIYVSTSSGTEVFQRNITTTSTSFTAPISSTGANPPTTATFYLLTQINDNATTTYSDSTADTSLSTTAAPTANTTGTAFSKINIGTVGNIGNMSVKYYGTHLHVENNAGYVFNDAKWASYLNGNCYWDGTNWNRYDTTQPASCLVINYGQEPTFRSAGAGANPITWNQYRIFHEGNFTTRTHVLAYLSTQQTLVTSSWNRVKYDTVVIDYLNEFSTSNWYFTAANTGIYMVSFGVRLINCPAGTANIVLGTNQLNRSGNWYNVFRDSPNEGTVNYFATQVLYLPAGTQLECRVWQDTGTAATIDVGQSYTWVNISRIA